MIKIKKIHPLAQIPQPANVTDAGADLCSIENVVVQPLSRQLVHTGLTIELPTNNLYARIAPRSGLALKHGIDVLAGVIDSGYRGEVCVILFNTDKTTPYYVKQGDRIAQMIIEQCVPPIFIESDDLSASDRATNGFGSSGTN